MSSMHPPSPRRRLLVALAAAFSSLAQAADADNALRLKTQVVTAAGFEQEVAEAPASISVITREELEEKGAGSIAEALKDVEGIDVKGNVGKSGGMSVSMRGMPSDYTLILIDGRRQNAAGNVTPNGYTETQTSFMPPISAIERIEVVRGPMSTLYGSDAMGGVVNIITRKVDREWHSALTLEGTLHEDADYGNDRALSLYTSGPLIEDRLGLQLRGRIFRRDTSHLKYVDQSNVDIDVAGDGPSPVRGESYSVGGRLSMTPNNDHDFWLDLDSSRQLYDNGEGQLGPLGAAGGYDPELRFQRDQITLGHTARLSIGTLDSSLMRNKTETTGRLIPSGTPGKTPGDARTIDATNTVLDSKLVMPLGENHLATVGGQWWDARMNEGLALDKFKQHTWAVFMEDEWALRDDLALTLGGRYDKHDAFGGQFSPRAYLVWNTTEEWIVKGGVSRGYKTPRLDQLTRGITGFTGRGTIPMFGSPDLKPEKTTSTEIGTFYDNHQGFSAGATLFYNKFTDKIAAGPDLLNCSFEDDPDRPGCVDYGQWPKANTFAQSINIDEAVTQGAELFTRIQFNADWQLNANYTHTKSEQKTGANAGNPLTDTPKHLLNAKLRWQVNERFATWLSGEYASKRYRDRSRVRGAPSYADLGDFKSYSVFHLGANYQASKNITLNATIQNLLDKNFVDYQAYEENPGAVGGNLLYGNVYTNSEAGRRIWLSANIRF